MKQDESNNVFPKHFFWGASTASHQVEGGNHNQWSVWELANARDLAQTAHQHLSWLPRWYEVRNAAEEPDNYVSGEGVDHYNRYKEDFDILTSLNFNSFRFTVEWSRIEPEEGKWNKEAIEHYKKYIKELRRKKVEPFLNIWHWTLPVWFVEKGGFEKGSNLKYFDNFVSKIAKELIDEVEYVIVLNEPSNYTAFGYLMGEWPPQKRNIIQATMVYWNLAKCHKRAYKILKKHKPTIQVGNAAPLANIQAKRPRNLLDILTTRFMRYFWNWWFLNRIRRHQDFVGINYYFSDYYRGLGKRDNPKVPLNDMGWYMEPEGLYPLLLRTWAHYKKPIFVTENGLADENDEYRQWWLQETIIAMEKAISEGVDLRGYFYWSLLDNFEWWYGWWPKFGLVEVDRKRNMKRTIRPSARWFANWLAQNR